MTRILTNLSNVYVSDRPHSATSHVGKIHSPISNLQARIGSIGQSSTAAVDANGNTTDKVAKPYSDSTPEDCEARVEVALGVELVFRDRGELGGEDDGHDHAVDGDDLAENDRDEVLGADLRCPYTTADD